MPEFAKFVQTHAEKITPAVLERFLHELPLLKLEFTQIQAKQFPHLVDQLEFLADFVEDYAEGFDKEISLVAVAEAAFALMYAHHHTDVIPDLIFEMGRADDSSVVRAVLMRHQKVFKDYASRREMDWSLVTVGP